MNLKQSINETIIAFNLQRKDKLVMNRLNDTILNTTYEVLAFDSIEMIFLFLSYYFKQV